ncbi:hypothetical protein D3C86_2055920 [compost metagenome]
MGHFVVAPLHTGHFWVGCRGFSKRGGCIGLAGLADAQFPENKHGHDSRDENGLQLSLGIVEQRGYR